MKPHLTRRTWPFTVYVLMVLLLLLGVSAVAGGSGFLGDPSGKSDWHIDKALELAVAH
jgi:hypothetical protein